MAAPLWTIVLAAGAGRRLASVTGGVPKQYWRPQGTQSLLESTLERVASLTAPERTITIVDDTHRDHLCAMGVNGELGEVVYQPMDRGTAAGVLLPLAAVAAMSPDAIVAITPSDHGVDDDDCFRRGLRRAASRIERGLSEIVLFGVRPSAVTVDFGWITPGASRSFDGGNLFQSVQSFFEKPPLHEALALYASGAVWNTMVIVARVSALLDLYRRHLPFHADMMLKAQSLESEAREGFLREWYPELPSADFCRDLLTPSKNLCLYVFPLEMGWSDLGTPDRLAAWMDLQQDAPVPIAFHASGQTQRA